jgi:protocatechuate 3,4-dioxygenase, beta subunit
MGTPRWSIQSHSLPQPIKNRMNLRRRLLRSLSVLAALPLLPTTLRAQVNALKATPSEILGPFYPTRWDGDIDHDLLAFGGKSYAAGTPMQLIGRVLSTDGSAISGATIEIWQTDDTGKYRHPGDDGEGPADRGFQGYGRAKSDGEGRYLFRTLKPKFYATRPPHVHFKVSAPGHKGLVTQMYFAGENEERGRSFMFSKERDQLTIKTEPHKDGDKDGVRATFDLVLKRA